MKGDFHKGFGERAGGGNTLCDPAGHNADDDHENIQNSHIIIDTD
jgi:hypothetical protein